MKICVHFLTILIMLACVQITVTKIYATPNITNITDNRAEYGGQIPRFGKFEVTFQINNSVATNYFFPFDATPPSGLPGGSGITVKALFTDPNNQTFTQPSFYYQEFEDETKNSREWLYPRNSYSWKVRFSPDSSGNWSVRLSAQDSSGTTLSNPIYFTVSDSENKGFIRVSQQDTRYFEYENGTYFPALGINYDPDFVNPYLGNTEEFNSMKANGMQLSRFWLATKSIYAEPFSKWFSHNPAHITNEPLMGLSHPLDARQQNYNLTFPLLPSSVTNSEFYMWLNFDESEAANGIKYNFTPCRYISNIPLKQNTEYRIRVRYQSKDVHGPRVSSVSNFGVVVKQSDTDLWNQNIDSENCYYPGTGTLLAASYANNDIPEPNPEFAALGWRILESTFNSGTNDFLNKFLYLALENVADPNGTNPDTTPKTSGGHAFIEQIWLEEVLSGGQFGPNIIYKPSMSHHHYINQRDAYAFDKVLQFAESSAIYFKPVTLDKNDFILQSINASGTLDDTKNSDNFFGSGRTDTKVRWLQKAWWRYLQARWGYSTNIHGWELINEGSGQDNHLILADEFGKYMQCGVFEVNLGDNCTYNHPNSHLATTSFFSGSYPVSFWQNVSGEYPNIDYAEVHRYVNESESPELFYDGAMAAFELSMSLGEHHIGKPNIRGETGWQFTGENLFLSNVSDGLWLHNFIWAGVNPGGVTDHYWSGYGYKEQLYKITKQGVVLHDHRPKFKYYYNFVKDIPLNNGHYQDLAITPANSLLRVWGQKDLTNYRAHFWVQNSQHTWKNVYDGVALTPITESIIISDFVPNTAYVVEKWNTSSGQVASTQTITSDQTGKLTIGIVGLTTDEAYRIGDYSTTTTPPQPGDTDNDGDVDIFDYSTLLSQFNSCTLNCSANFDGDSDVDIFDYSILLAHFGS